MYVLLRYSVYLLILMYFCSCFFFCYFFIFKLLFITCYLKPYNHHLKTPGSRKTILHYAIFHVYFVYLKFIVSSRIKKNKLNRCHTRYPMEAYIVYTCEKAVAYLTNVHFCTALGGKIFLNVCSHKKCHILLAVQILDAGEKKPCM